MTWNWLKWFRPKAKDIVWEEKPEQKEEKKSPGIFSTHTQHKSFTLEDIEKAAFPVRVARPVDKAGKAMDESCTQSPAAGYRFSTLGGVPDNVVGWFLSQSFIGYQLCAIMAQQWLVNRACKIPPEDATRNGWKITGLDPDKVQQLEKIDRKRGIKKQVQEFSRFNRVFGIRIAIFCVDSDDPEYYSKPFNIDGVTEGSYRGISQVDPYWCAPELQGIDVSDPASENFYEPTYWSIAGKRYHRSHLVLIRYSEVPDVLKPTYQFGGLPLPQLIWERVYGAERSANEGPQLLMSKRLNVVKTDLDEAMADPVKFVEKLQEFAERRDNFGVMPIGNADEYEQHETSLGDVDSVIMTEYQLVASVAEMPSTKLLGTSPKGFNPTGDFEMSAYRETLASIQEHEGTPFLNRHYQLLTKSTFGESLDVEVVWNPLDEPTEVEQAQTGLAKAQTAQIYQDLGVVSAQQNQQKLKDDESSGYEFEEDDNGGDDADSERLAEQIAAILQPAVSGTAVPAPTEATGQLDEGELN
jgi:phage-related protein (TIGR01555 family)